MQLLAYCVAASLRPTLAPSVEQEATAYDVALSLTGADVAEYWRPTKDNYLSRITREQLLQIGEGLFGKTWADSRRERKKGALVEELDKAFADPARYGEGRDGWVMGLVGWLPAGMAFTVPEAKKPAKKKKAKK